MTDIAGVLDPPKLPGEKPFIVFDFSNIFEAGTSITGTPAFVVDVDSGVGGATALTAVSPPTVSGLAVSQQVQDGAPETRYGLNMTATADNGDVETIRLVMPVVSKRLG